MEALSYYSNWDTSNILETELPPELVAFPDYLVETNDMFYSETCSNSHLYDFSNDNVNFLATEPFLLQQELEPLHYPKRQRPCDYQEIYYPDNQCYFNPAFFNGLAQDYLPPEFAVPLGLPDFPAAGYSCESSTDHVKKEATTSLSAQSIAARQRRRKITEKTQELSKLVPGGPKMNTAEMLQAAYKYIKYLQAQVGILEFMDSYHQEKREPFESSHEDDFQGLVLESPLIQEKLYSTEKCVVPEKFVQELTNDHRIVKSNPQLLSIVMKQEH